MADLAAWNDSDDDEPRDERSPTSTKVRWNGRSSARTRATPRATTSQMKTPPAWQDDDDEDIRVDLRSASRLKKLRQAPTDRVLKVRLSRSGYERDSKPRKARKIGPPIEKAERPGRSGPGRRERRRRRRSQSSARDGRERASAVQVGYQWCCVSCIDGSFGDGRFRQDVAVLPD